MLEMDEVSEIMEIIDQGIAGMEEYGHVHYSLKSVHWDDEDGIWVVGFYTDYGNLDEVGITVKRVQGGYISTGRS